ncbi:addiction module protein [Paucibacter sp. TC2R-5]|uniref:addiction module protein n=1 Tax=Paucibacter sp. TC2R-5 TaxID=2893555 RepID=UPI0021E35D39|nr:addiction module protein [Paucibacter sp. TC2R-5]MCV2357638.1 addiction module protein [Paucibacter sp. TC2R-5]
MSATVDQPSATALKSIEAAALLLKPDEQSELAERLWASVEGVDLSDPAWEAKIKRRMQEVDSGAVQCRPRGRRHQRAAGKTPSLMAATLLTLIAHPAACRNLKETLSWYRECFGSRISDGFLSAIRPNGGLAKDRP